MSPLINRALALPSTAIVLDEVAEERDRQIQIEGWDAKHDDKHTNGAMASAAAAYALSATRQGNGCDISVTPIVPWPLSWSAKWWKPKSQRRDLIRAAALLVAEIERIDRKAAKEKS
jgi:hypothetical protein